MTQERSAEEEFGAQVRAAREARGWTLERLRAVLRDASGIDLSLTAMARLEQAKRPIRLDEVAALSQLLGLSLRRYDGIGLRVSREEYDAAVRELLQMPDVQSALRDRIGEIRARLEPMLHEEALLRREFEGAKARALELAGIIQRYENDEGRPGNGQH